MFKLFGNVLAITIAYKLSEKLIATVVDLSATALIAGQEKFSEKFERKNNR